MVTLAFIFSPGFHPALFTFNLFGIGHENEILFENKNLLQKTPSRGLTTIAPGENPVNVRA